MQPVSADYDATKNDPKALEIVAKMTTALGGAETWDKAKQIRWDVKVLVKGEVRGVYSHAWDRWEGRHRFETTSIDSYNKSIESNDPKLREDTTVMYKLFERNRGTAYHGKNELGADDRKKATENAYERWRADAYLLTIAYRLTEPGVYIEHVGENSDEHCRDTCDIIKVTFDPMVGKDTYWLNINKQTNMPELIEMELAGKAGRIGYKFTKWQDAGGLKFPAELDNIGARNLGDSEVWQFNDVRIGSPDDELYIPRVY